MNDRYADSFREEAAELLTELEDALLELEQQPHNSAIIDRAFRALHTIKGAAGMTGFDVVETFTHEVETVFERVRSGQLEGNHELVNLTLAARDQIKHMIESAFNGTPADKEETARLISRLRHLLGTTSSLELNTDPTATPRPVADKELGYRIRFRPPTNIFQRGIQPTSLLRELAGLGVCQVTVLTDKIPPLSELDPELCYLAWDLTLTTAAGEDAIRDVFIFVESDCELQIEPIEAVPPDGGSSDRTLDEIPIKHDALSPEDFEQVSRNQPNSGKVPIENGLVNAAQADAVPEDQSRPVAQEERHNLTETSSIRVRAEKLDSLVNLVGELVTVQARLSRSASEKEDPTLLEIAEIVEQLTWEMRDQILNIRMLPIGTTFSRFRRLVRDLSNELGKKTELFTSGAETELDKTVIERLGDSLVHLLRNAVDHGIETVSARQAAGKQDKGSITLSATHSGAKIIIEIKDDGCGLNRAAIRSRAQNLGLLGEADLDDKALLSLIFTPGFSTAGEISNLSGRGVGMDVVKRTIEGLQGTIEVTSEPGAGTCISIQLPLTLAIIDGLLVEVADEVFVLPLAAIEECIELARTEALSDKNLITVRGELIPYLRLRERFELKGASPAIEQIVVAEVDGRRIGFAVDRVVGEHQTVIKSLGKLYREIKGISGATILGDGTVALILDLPPLIREAEQDERLQIEARQVG